jgi:hypothetical protein
MAEKLPYHLELIPRVRACLVCPGRGSSLPRSGDRDNG